MSSSNSLSLCIQTPSSHQTCPFLASHLKSSNLTLETLHKTIGNSSYRCSPATQKAPALFCLLKCSFFPNLLSARCLYSLHPASMPLSVTLLQGCQIWQRSHVIPRRGILHVCASSLLHSDACMVILLTFNSTSRNWRIPRHEVILTDVLPVTGNSESLWESSGLFDTFQRDVQYSTAQLAQGE